MNELNEQVKVYLEPSQSKLNEDVSISDNATYQSTLEASDLSSESAQVSEHLAVITWQEMTLFFRFC